MVAGETGRSARPTPANEVCEFTPEELALTPFDAAEFLDSEESISAYLAALLEEGNPKAFAAGLGDVARARGMSQVARDAGVSRESLYRALSGEGNPEFGTILKVMRALGLKLVTQPARTDLEDKPAT